MGRTRRFLAWGLMLAAGGGLLLFLSVWSLATHRVPAEPAPLAEERDLGLFDPHLHARLLEVGELAHTSELPPASPGHRRVFLRLAVRSSAAELLMDPSRFALFLETGRHRYEPLPTRNLPAEIDGVPIVERLPGPLSSEEVQQVWVAFELPFEARHGELWMIRDSWAGWLLPGLVKTPIYDRAVFALELDRP